MADVHSDATICTENELRLISYVVVGECHGVIQVGATIEQL